MNGLANWEAEGRKRTVKVAAAIQRVAAREMEGVVETHGCEDEQEGRKDPLSCREGAVRDRGTGNGNGDRILTRTMYKGSRMIV